MRMSACKRARLYAYLYACVYGEPRKPQRNCMQASMHDRMCTLQLVQFIAEAESYFRRYMTARMHSRVHACM